MFTYDGLLWVAADYKGNLNNTRQYLRVVEIALELFAALKEKGVQRVYCTAETEAAIRFNEGLGFELVGATVQDRHEVMVKEF